MQSRAEAHDSLDDFPTPPWATRALCRFLRERGEALHLQEVWEPACNRGYMARPLGEYFDRVHATDVHDYGFAGQTMTADFLVDWAQPAPAVDWIITNPPFRLGAEFIKRGLQLAQRGVAVLVRSAFVEGQERYETLFCKHPEAYFLPFVERVVMWQGVLLDPDVPVWHAKIDEATGEDRGQMKKPTSATAYAWLVFYRDSAGFTELSRIPPCRRQLTLAGDYPAVPEHLLGPTGGLLDLAGG